MAQDHRNKLLNQAQISSLGRYLSPHRALSDMETTQRAIEILKDKTNDLNRKFMPKADEQLRKKLKLSTGDYARFKINMSRLSTPTRNKIKDIVNGKINDDTLIKALSQYDDKSSTKNTEQESSKGQDNHDESNPNNNHESNNHDDNDTDESNSQYEENPFMKNDKDNSNFLNH